MDQKPDNKIIRGILEHKSRIIKDEYDRNFPMIERMVMNNGGDHQHAKDIYQEAWIIVYKKLQCDKPELSCKLSTYLYAICKRLWLQEKRKLLNHKRKSPISPDFVEESNPFEVSEEDNIVSLFQKHFNQLSEDCKKIMLLHFNNTSIEEIQKIMNYQNPHYVMDRKYRCKKSLIQRINKDPNFKNVKNEYTEKFRSIY